MAQYTVTLTDVEELALSHVVLDHQWWIDNAVHERCRAAIDDIAKIAVEKCFELSIQVPANKEATVQLAFDQGWVKSVAQANKEGQLAAEKARLQ
jgi:hypothetical protein